MEFPLGGSRGAEDALAAAMARCRIGGAGDPGAVPPPPPSAAAPRGYELFGESSHRPGAGAVGARPRCGFAPPPYPQPLRAPPQPPHREDALEDYVLYLARNVTGWEVLLRMFYEGKPEDRSSIAAAVIGHAAELMESPYGQLVVHGVLKACGEERAELVLSVAHDPPRFFRLCLDFKGADEVVNAIKSLKTWQQFELVKAALAPTLLELIKDSNGIMVIHCWLESFPAEMNQFIFNAIAMHCTQIACHQNGVTLLQKCISRFRMNNGINIILFAISSNSLYLAQNRYGNYIVQDVLVMAEPFSLTTIAYQFSGHYVELSKQKYSSNVVEICLKVFNNKERSAIIYELLSHPHFEYLVSDEYANYVIYTALVCCKDFLRDQLVSAILSLKTVNRRHPHCLKIFNKLSKEDSAQERFVGAKKIMDESNGCTFG